MTDLDNSACDLAAEAAKIMETRIARIIRTVDPLDWQPKRAEVPVAGNMDGFEVTRKIRATPSGARNINPKTRTIKPQMWTMSDIRTGYRGAFR